MPRSKKAQAIIDNALAMEIPDDSVGLGIDVVEIERVGRAVKRSPAFRERTFTADERAYCDKHANPTIHYATRFAAKEAVLKALGIGFYQHGVKPSEIEIQRTSAGKPFVSLSGAAEKLARKMGVKEIPLSLSYTHTEAVACALAITEKSQEAQQNRRDPTEELTRQFKEARGLLDDI